MKAIQIKERLKERFYNLSVKKRLTYSNILMILIPVAVTVVTAIGALLIALYAFERFYLPRLGVSLKGIHEMGAQYESELKSFAVLLVALLFVLLVILVSSIIVTNRFLTRFMFRRVEEPLELLTDGVAKVSSGELDYSITYDRADEFKPVCDAFNGMTVRLKTAADRSAEEEQSRRELFAGISHDLRSPLTSVRAYTEALLDGVAKTPEGSRRYLTKIRLHEAEIERIVEALFLYTKMGLKDYPVRLQKLDIKTELTRICEENPSDSHITVDLSAVLPVSVTADPFLLERIVLNLLDNSGKYRRGEVARVSVSTEKTDDGIILSVADDGIGVKEELLTRLFDPFYRADPARNNPSGGSGLGLAVVREAVEHLGGTVWAENASTGGLNVKIKLKGADCDGENSDS